MDKRKRSQKEEWIEKDEDDNRKRRCPRCGGKGCMDCNYQRNDNWTNYRVPQPKKGK